ncbi:MULTISPECIES: hypothetical protein [unclassified Pseudomonas]|uniref:hypothetical protein n=1 Tax=unclassified Pseudomonas TaxID=196821 RepID=UPI0009E96744|nr:MULTISPECIES: hypothetical protein [unclassified Pseudomonas]
MCTLTHFAQPFATLPPTPSNACPAQLRSPERPDEVVAGARFQVVLAGNAFFHIREISTGCVRGFRASHNEACALARSFESRI